MTNYQQLVTVQVGQCGNQVGKEIYDTLSAEATQSDGTYCDLIWNTFFHQDTEEGDSEVTSSDPETKTVKRSIHTARAVLVDMEPKVITQVMSEAEKNGVWRYNPLGSFNKSSGSANNWAYGHSTHGPTSKEAVLDLTRREVEACDHFGGFLITLSLAGGTGSGVGTYTTEILREEYPKSYIVNLPVWPFQTGEVIIQNYNAVLSLSHLYQEADAIMIMENDQLHTVCNKLLNIKQVSFDDMNKVIAHNVGNTLLPCHRWRPNSTDTMKRERVHFFSGIMRHLVPHTNYKMIHFKTIPQMPSTSVAFSSYLWSGLTKHLHQMLLTDAKIEEGINWNVKIEDAGPHRSINRSLSNVLFARGSELNKFDPSSFFHPKLYTSWTLKPMMVCTSTKTFKKYSKCATLLSNSQSAVQPLDKIVSKAYNMYHSGAYLYQYEAHGITRDDFDLSFVQLEKVIQDYRSL
ncbi:hypothetical protein PROFUN_13865 [Planoprotostelium fungivorum]|uniref:Tubulin delta chain n=1 Tax=Planoprotostelium fungivorum TaxID=1890364 RepID=A0A2P6N2Q4_9EUKA|nr:hypothetical protein PROFUN_13980 [Planoprotostelium fungivorum]PRP78255.1 hypothetical protein PROFUN_13865 [Planoprotostelium fungivorum]